MAPKQEARISGRPGEQTDHVRPRLPDAATEPGKKRQRSNRRDSLDTIVNRSVNQTLSRTVITAGTTFLSVLALYLFGGEVLKGFAFTMLVGIVAGTYSTIFIASAIAIILSGRKGRVGGTAAAAVADEGTAPARPRRGRRAGK